MGLVHGLNGVRDLVKPAGAGFFFGQNCSLRAAICPKSREQHQDVAHSCNSIKISINSAIRDAAKLRQQEQQIRGPDQSVVVEIPDAIHASLHRAAASVDGPRPVADPTGVERADARVDIIAHAVVVGICRAGSAANP